jgi:alanine racemase
MTQPFLKYPSWLEVNLQAIENNVSIIKDFTDAEVMAIVKANGYGHGAVEVARAAQRGGATWCAVSNVDEALELRSAGLDCPILILGYSPPGRFADVISNQISITVWNEEQIQLASTVAKELGIPLHVHLKIDTGMSRLGAQPDETLKFVKLINDNPYIVFEAIFTHFARADEPDSNSTELQDQIFNQTLKRIHKEFPTLPLIHAANSAATIYHPDTIYDLVRVGILMYGLPPSDCCPVPKEIKQAITWKSVLSHVKTLPAGRGISYGHIYTTSKKERIGTIPVGYADGFRRVNGNEVLIRGKRVPVVGRVCMDQLMIQLDTVPNAQIGDEVVIIGKQGKEQITPQDIAKRWGTVNYEVICGLNARVPRVYT